MAADQVIHVIILSLLLFSCVFCGATKHRLHHRDRINRVHFSDYHPTITKTSSAVNRGVTSLPTINDIVNKVKADAEFQISDCKVKVSLNGGIFTIQPSAETCGGRISMKKLADHFLPGNKLAEMTNKFLDPDKYEVKKIEINKNTKTIEFQTSAKENVELLPNKLILNGASMKLKMGYDSTTFDWLMVQIEIQAKLSFAGKNIDITLTKKEKEGELNFSTKTDEISIPNFLKTFTPNPLTDDDSKSVVEKLTSLTIKQPKLSGYYDPVHGHYEFVFSGSVTGKTFASATFYVVVTKPPDKDIKPALVGKFDAVSPAKVLGDITGKDLSNVPLLKDITSINFVFEAAKDKIMIIKNPDLVEALKEFVTGGTSICEGVRIKIILPVKQILKIQGVPETISMSVIITSSGLQFKFPDSFTSDLMQILKALAPKAELSPSWLDTKGSAPVKIKDFSFDFKSNSFSVEIFAPGPMKLGGLLKIQDINVKVSHKSDTDPWEWSFSSVQTLFGETVLETKLTKTGTSDYELNAKISRITTLELAKYFGTKFISEDILDKYKFLEFGVEDVQIDAKFGSKTIYFRIQGTPILFNWNGAKVEAIVSSKENIPAMALGIDIARLPFDELTNALFGRDLSQASWLSQVSVGMVVSNVDAGSDDEHLQFTFPELKDFKVKKGFQFQIIAEIPDDCEGEQLCEQSKKFMEKGDSKEKRKLTLSGEVTPSGMELRASFAMHMALGKNVELSEAIFTIKLTQEEDGVFFEIKLTIKEPKLVISGRLGIGFTGKLQIEARMTGLWKNPFGLKRVSFGDLLVSVGIQPGNPVPSLEFQGKLILGEESGKQIKAETAIGIDTTIPIKSYFYSEISGLTLGGIASALGFDIKLPKVLEESGFPGVVTVGFSLQKKELKALQVELPGGFLFIGTVSLLGYKLGCKVIVDIPSKIEVNVQMSPIKIGTDLIRIQKSEEDSENGPLFYAKVATSGVQVKIQGYVTVLGISAGADIDVSDSGFRFKISGNIFNMFKAELDLQASYGSIEKASFSVSACLTTSPKDVERKVTNTLSEAAKESEKIVQESKDKIKSIEELRESTSSTITNWEAKLNSYRIDLTKKAKDMEESKKILHEECIDKCPTELIGGPSWNPNCIELEKGEWVGCPVWDDHKYEVISESCLADCKGAGFFEKVAAEVKQMAMKVLLQLLDGIKRLFHIGKTFYEKAKIMVQDAKEIYNKVKEKVKDGLEIAKKGIGSFFKINSLCFSTKLEKVGNKKSRSLCLGFKVNLDFQGKNHDLDVNGCLGYDLLKAIAKQVLEKLYQGVLKIKDSIGEIKNKMLGKLEGEKKELEKEIKKGSEESDTDSDKRDHVWTEEELYFKKLAYEELPRYTLKDDATMEVFERKAAYLVAAGDNPMAKATIPPSSSHNVTVETASRRQLQTLSAIESPNPCVQMRNVVNRYKEMSGHLVKLARSSINQEHRFRQSAFHRRKRLRDVVMKMRSKCLQLGCPRDELDDALYFAKLSRNGTTNWVHEVRSQITSQDKDAFKFWKKEANIMYKRIKGLELHELASQLNHLGMTARKRMTVTSKEDMDQDHQLDKISKGFHKLFVTGHSLSLREAIPVIREIHSNVKVLASRQRECRRQIQD